MPHAPLSKLQPVDPRTVWPHEADDFTPWLLDNADHLADVLGIELALTANEHPVGGFSLDLIGEDLTNDCTLIVENQLATTDHTRLGQLLTYAGRHRRRDRGVDGDRVPRRIPPGARFPE